MLALTVPWWVTWRDREPVKSALVQADAEHCDAVVLEVLAENKRSWRKPATYLELAVMLGRDPSNVHRWLSGRSLPNLLEMQSAAFLLGKELTDLLPGHEDRIAAATAILSEYRVSETEAKLILCRDRKPVSREEARAYVAYRLAPGATAGDRLEQSILQLVIKGLKSDAADSPVFANTQTVGTAVWKVVERLEPVLGKVAHPFL